MGTPSQDMSSKRKANPSPETKSREPRELPALTISSPPGMNSPAPVGRKLVNSGPKIRIQGEDLVQEEATRLEATEQTLHEIEECDASLSQKAADVDDAGYQSGSSGDWFIVPELVQYTLYLSCPNHHIPNKHGHFRLNNRRSYMDIEKLSSELVENERGLSTDTKVLNFRHGYCIISLGEDDTKRKVTVTNIDEWKNMCASLVTNFNSGDRRKFTLSIYREYFELLIRPASPGHPFAADKRYELQELMCKNLDEKEFVSQSDLSKFTSDHMIDAIVSHDPCWGSPFQCAESESLVQEIKQKGAKRLLVMCLLAEFAMICLKKLIEKGYNDQNLPLAISSKAPSAAEFCCERHKKPFRRIRSRHGVFQVAEFKVLGAHQELHPQSIVPIVPVGNRSNDLASGEELGSEEENTDSEPSGGRSARDQALIGEGTHGWVYRVRIDPRQHSLSEDRDTEFALKEFKMRNLGQNANFAKESEMLRSLRQFSDAHLTTHLVSWTQGGKYFMLFPLAKCNMREYMRKYAFSHTKTEYIWLLAQFSGLASALNLIHNMTFSDSTVTSDESLSPTLPQHRERKAGWHHDLKAENILYFDDVNTGRRNFQIGDFGSSKIHTIRSRSHPTHSFNGTPTYEPPEMESEGATSRPYDVWSLGCVFLELLVWAVLGSEKVKTFKDEREGKRTPNELNEDDGFWEKKGANDPIALRESVTRWIDKLKSQVLKQPQQPFKDLLDVIIQMLTINRVARIEASVLSEYLSRILIQKKIDLEQNDDFSRPISRGSESSSISLLPLPQRRYSSVSASGTFFDNDGAAISGTHMGFVHNANNLIASPIDSLSPHTNRPHQRHNSNASESMRSPAVRSRATSSASGHSPSIPL